jgi:hypothetical protein
MFKKIVIISSLILSTSNLYASGNMNSKPVKKSGMNHGAEHSEKEEMNHSRRKMLDDKTKTQVLNVLEKNETLHASFFEYNGKAAEKSAKILQSSIGEVSNVEISKLLAFSKDLLSEIKADRNRKKNNQTYHTVSMALIYIVNNYDVGNSYNAYSCPMVKMKWIQNSTKLAKINNPYMNSMPMCGSQDSQF